MVAHPRPGEDTNYSTHNILAHLREHQGPVRQSRGVRADSSCLPGRRLEALGPESPPVTGVMHGLVKGVWKQRWYQKASVLADEMRKNIAGMGEGRFGKYQAEEKGTLDAVMTELEAWRD